MSLSVESAADDFQCCLSEDTRICIWGVCAIINRDVTDAMLYVYYMYLQLEIYPKKGDNKNMSNFPKTYYNLTRSVINLQLDLPPAL